MVGQIGKGAVYHKKEWSGICAERTYTEKNCITRVGVTAPVSVVAAEPFGHSETRKHKQDLKCYFVSLEIYLAIKSMGFLTKF